MKSILDLTGTDLESTIQYNISSFPDGQQTIDITSNYITSPIVEIRSRLNTFRDLELILCATQALRGVGIKDIELYIPYIIGGRSDRKFVVGGVNYLKDIIGPIINSQEYSKVTVMDPHSDVTESVLNKFEKIDNINLVRFALSKIDNKDGAQGRTVLISPDAGAYKKIYDVAKYFKIEKIVTATKIRDLKTGKIIHTDVPIDVYDVGKNFVIIDDICDGGRTFIEIAKGIMERGMLSSISNEKSKIYLIVTHGIFSAGFTELNKYFDGIFCTNSYRNVAEYENNVNTNVKQLNVFYG
jgi:ribose-phosphate pyrophosphokinase